MISPPTFIKLRLRLDAPSSNGVWGDIWFETVDFAFPSRHWNDFAETLLGWWMINLVDIYQSRNKWYEKAFLFMDGDCEAVLRNGNPVTIHFKRDGATQKSCVISLPAFAREVIACRRHFARTAVATGWWRSASSALEECDWLETLIGQTEQP